MSAAVAALVLGVAPSFASDMAVKVVKTKLPDGCEYKKVPGQKKKQVVCIDEMNENGGGVSAPEASVDGSNGQNNGGYNGNGKGNGAANGGRHANNGGGNGTNDGVPGNAPNKDPNQ